MDKELKLMMTEFLIRHYPIGRYKHLGTKRFKRGVLIDNGDIIFFDNKEKLFFMHQYLTNILKKVFNCKDQLCKSVIQEFI